MKNALSLFYFLSCFSFMGPVLVFAEGQCPKLTDYKSVLKCAEQNSIEIRAAQLEYARSQFLVQSAGQWSNPEFTAESYREETDLHLGIPLEFGKVSARRAIAEGEKEKAGAELAQIQSQVRGEILLKLHRLRQLIHEQEIVNEAVGTFSKLVKQYAGRPKLSPEQEMSLSVFQLSKSEYELKRATGQDEISELGVFFKLKIGLGVDEIKNLVPDTLKTWPQIVGDGNIENSPQAQALNASVRQARGEKSLAVSNSFPTVMVGPSMKLVDEPGRKEEMYGFNLSFPLPVFNWNGGARAAGKSAIHVSELKRDLGLKNLKLRRQQLKENYTQSVQVLNESLSHSQIEKRHTSLERLFLRGVVPSALVIEAHRTTYELEKIRHERELKALEALVGIYILDGKSIEGIL